MTLAEFPQQAVTIPEHNRLRGLAAGDPHPQYAHAGHSHDAGDAATVDGLEAAEFARGELGYVEISSNPPGITAEVDVAGLSVTVIVAANRRVRVSAEALVSKSAADGACIISIWEDSTRLRYGYAQISNTSDSQSVECTRTFTPTAGSHTYKVTASRSGTGTMTIGAAASVASLQVEDLGPA